MRIQEKQKELEKEIIANLCAIPKMPEDMLPHTVYVEEEGEDENGYGVPVYTMYKLEEIRPDGNCTIYNAATRERFTDRHLYEINIDWLVTVWERYLELCVEQDIWKENAIKYLHNHTDKSDAEILSFVETSWDRCRAYTDNLKTLLGENEAKEIWIFSFPIDDFERNAPIEDIIADYGHNPGTQVRKMTLPEFIADINDECFDDMHNWVRTIELPK